MEIGDTINSPLESSQRWSLCKLVAVYLSDYIATGIIPWLKRILVIKETKISHSNYMSVMGRIPVLVVAEQLESDKPPTDNNYKLSTKGEKYLKALGSNQKQAEPGRKWTPEKKKKRITIDKIHL